MFEYNLDKYLSMDYNKEFKEESFYTEFKLKQNDYGDHRFYFSPLTECDYCIIKFKLPDEDVVVSEILNLKEGRFVYEISPSVVRHSGKVMGEISFYKAEIRVSSTKFYFEVVEDINCDNAITEEESSTFNDLILQLVNTKKEAEENYRKFIDNDVSTNDNKAYILMKNNSVKRLDIINETGIFITDFELKDNGLEKTDEKYLLMHTSELVFSTSENDFTFESEKNIIFTGLDCQNKVFHPLPKTKYVITFYFDGADILAFVGGYDID
ncbi:MAG: DUF2479 domain-containing protein [Ruminococcaceae bacterium]|nr:DUF2479 domain-containing protein [Oscillospiraceae bacterium]